MENKIKKYISYKIKFIESTKLWQAYYQILSIISRKEFIQLNVKMDIAKRYVKSVELNTKVVSAAWNIKTLKIT